ncbi:MAG: potassium channel protein [Longimicrobiales bacterium]
MRPVPARRHIRPGVRRSPLPAARNPALKIYAPTAPDWEADIKDLRVRLLAALVFMVAVTVVGTVGFHVIDPDAGWVRAFFMTAITLTTVGYGHEVQLGSDAALVFTAGLILVGMGGVLYFVSTATAFILEGQLGHVFRRRRMEKELAALRDHLIVCGSGPTTLYTARELVAVERAVVLVVDDAERATEAAAELPTAIVVVGDPGDDEVLRTAGVERAAGLVACTESDRENLVVSLSARQLNPNLRIVSRVQDVEAGEKVRKAGADAVVSPDFIGGLRLASELVRPTVVTFLDVMLRDRDLNLRIEEVRIHEGSESVGRTLGDLALNEVDGVLLLAVRAHDGRWQYNPPGSHRVEEGTVLVFMGSPEHARALAAHVGGALTSASAG